MSKIQSAKRTENKSNSSNYYTIISVDRGGKKFATMIQKLVFRSNFQ